jgi:hypothetical protein
MHTGNYGVLLDAAFTPYAAAGRDSFTGITLTVSSAITYPNVNFTLEPGGAIQGVLSDSGGEPLPGIEVSLIVPATGRVLRRATSNSTGQYAFPNVAPGEYYIKYDRFVPCGCYNNEYFTGEDSDEIGAVVVQPDETTAGVDARLACNAPPDITTTVELYLPRVQP